MRRLLPLALATCLLGSCASLTTAPSRPRPAVPQNFPPAAYPKAAAAGEPVFQVEPALSLVTMRVYRAGALARFGHDHVVASHDVHGFVLFPRAVAARRADLYAQLALLSVDEPGLRAQAGFDTQPSLQDIEGTRHNMLEKVLEVGRFPFVSLHLDGATGDAPVFTVHAAISLHGQTRTMPVVIKLDTPSPELIYARGRFSINQTDFGITPYSLLGGALRVEDRVDIAFDLAAVRVTADAVPK